MSSYNGPEDIYKELVDDSDENWLYGLVAFAVIEEQRIEWMKHYSKNNGNLPSSEEIYNWYKQLPPSALLRAKGTAESALQTYSGEVIEITLEDQRKEVEEGLIVAEIREIKKFWPQFGVNLAGGFAATILFAALLLFVALVVFNDISPVDIAVILTESTEDASNGQEN